MKISQYTRMKSQKYFRKSEDCQGFIKIYWGFKCKIRKSRSEKQIKELNSELNVQCNEWNKQMVNCFQKQIQIHKIRNKDPSLFSPEVNNTLTCTQRLEERIPNIKDFTDFTIYRGEIQKYTKEIWRFTRISLIYTRIFRKWQSKCVYISVTYYKMTNISEMYISRRNKYRPPLSSKMRKYTICITFGSQILRI